MKPILTTLLFLMASLSLTACASDEEKGVKLMEQMAELVDANKADCDKMGAELETFMSANAETIKKLKDKKSSKEEEKALEEKYGARIKAATGKMMGGVMKCAKNAKVGAAMKKM